MIESSDWSVPAVWGLLGPSLMYASPPDLKKKKKKKTQAYSFLNAGKRHVVFAQTTYTLYFTVILLTLIHPSAIDVILKYKKHRVF